jgi:methylaspartate mutase epsilon subunit
MTRMAIYLARNQTLESMPEFQSECELIRREVVPVVDKILEMGDGDAALGTVRSAAAGVLDIPWSPNKHVKSRVMPARDAQGYLCILDPGEMPFPRDVLEIHEAGLRRRAELQGVSFGNDLAVSSVYEISETLEKLVP